MIERGVGHWNRLVVVCAAILIVTFARSCTPREAHAQQMSGNTDFVLHAAPTDESILYSDISRSLIIMREGKTILKFGMDGQVEFGEGVKPNQAAKELGAFLKEYIKCDVPPKGKQ